LQFCFADHSLDTDRRELRRGGALVALEPQVFDLLVYLVQNRERVVSKDDLLEAVWDGRIVSESALTSRITAVRKAIGDVGSAQRLIRTLPRKGLRFIGSVEEVEQRALRDTSEMLSESPARAELALPEKPSIAVLPFANISGDPEQEFFADGIVEEIITALSKVRWFFVIARNSSFTYKGRTVDLRQVGRELGVRYVLEGSVRKSADRVRVSGQLIEAATGSHLWAERYDRAISDIFAVQDEITERVVAAIEPELYAAEHFRSQRKPPESLDAWECVIRALAHMGEGTGAGDAEAKMLCRRAIAIAPGYGQAHSLLAWLLIRTSWSGGEVAAILPEAMAEARTALRLDERDSWAHVTHGMVLWRSRRHGEAEREFRRALELNPNFALAHALLALAVAVDGAPAGAAASAEHALRLSPSDRLVDFYAVRAMKYAHFANKHYADSLAWSRRLVDRYPEYTAGYTWLAATAALHGDVATAADALAVLRSRRRRASLAWMRENVPHSGDILERLLTGLRIAGLPD
jgi:TolB-like protein/Tfp pilus assembly protein PilF